MFLSTKYKEDKSMEDLKTIGRYFLLYNIILVCLELILRSQMDGSLTENFLFFLCFVPAQSLFLTMLSGLGEIRANVIATSLLLFLLDAYYIAQLIYYNNFGSLFSGSMIKMGTEAVGNFGWTLEGAVRNSLIGIILILLFTFVVGDFFFFKLVNPEKIPHRYRPVLLVLIIPVWTLGVQATRLDGTDRQSAYTVYHDILSDTDNMAAHLGALTTTLLEIGFPPFGSSSGEVILTSVNMDLLLNPDGLQHSETPESQTGPTASQPQEYGETKDSDESMVSDVTRESGDSMDSDVTRESGDSMDSDESRESQSSSSETSEENPENTEGSETAAFTASPHIFAEIDLQKIAGQEQDPTLKNLSLFLENRGATDTNEYTGLFEGYNLIYICAEAFWTYAVNEQVTPTLYKMANQGIVLENYYNSFRNTTTNGEFAFSTSLWPDFSRKSDEGSSVGSFAQSAHCYMPMGLGDLFEGIGVPAHAYHNYLGEYYRRILSWPNLGYTCKFNKDGMNFTSSWPASDLELMEQSVDDFIDEERFHAYYMTFSGHGPYSNRNAICQKNIEFVKENMAEGYLEDVYGYLAGNRELDKAMEYLLNRLEEAGKLENTVIVIAGDHYPYNLSAQAADQLAGHELDTDFEMYQSTCIIYNAGLKTPIVSDTYCCNVDILPTILNLFGIPFDSRLMMGRDIFSDGIHKAVIYNKSFITDLVRYNSKTGETQWSEKADDFSAELKKTYLDTMISLLNSEYYASMKILDLNYFQYLWHQSGLMTEEELAAEKLRAQQVQAADEQYSLSEEE